MLSIKKMVAQTRYGRHSITFVWELIEASSGRGGKSAASPLHCIRLQLVVHLFQPSQDLSLIGRPLRIQLLQYLATTQNCGCSLLIKSKQHNCTTLLIELLLHAFRR